MKTFIVGFVIGIIAVPLAIYVYFVTGSAPVATAAGAMPFETALAKKALAARVDKEMPRSVPIPADETNFAAGARIYRDDCAVCHGLPDHGKPVIAQGMFPKPPALFAGKGVTDDPPGETYWKVKNGIRMTGMPSFSQSLSGTQMWQVSLLLADADKLPASVKQTLAQSQLPPTAR